MYVVLLLLIYVIFVKVFGRIAFNLMHMAQHLWSEMSMVQLSPLVRRDGDEQKIVDCKTFISAIDRVKDMIEIMLEDQNSDLSSCPMWW